MNADPATTVCTIIPAYKAAHTISRAIDSVLAQSRPPDEIVVIDDGSPDDLATVVARFGDRVRMIRQPNRGAACARNVGIENSRSTLIAFLDADDYWEPLKLEAALEVFAQNPEVGLVAGRYYFQLPDQDRWIPDNSSDLFDRTLRPTGEDVLEVATHVWTGSVVLRRSVLGSNRFVSGLEPAEDRDLWVRMVNSAPVYLLGEPLVTAVLEPHSLSRSDVDRDYANMLRVVRRHSELLGYRGLKKWEAQIYRRWASGHLARGQARAALTAGSRRLRLEPWSVEAWWVLLKSCFLLNWSNVRTGACPPVDHSPSCSTTEPGL